MDYCLITIYTVGFTIKHGQVQSERYHVYNKVVEQAKDSIVHLSLHPFSLVQRTSDNNIIDFLKSLFRPNYENSVTKPFRENLRKDMDTSALMSQSPPFILTSELVCRLTDEEIMNVVDRIVALLDSDSPLDDDTILRIATFHLTKLKSVYLPELYRKAGRSTEQYFHALNSLLSVSLDNFQLCPIKCLLTPKPSSLQPTLNEWDDVDLATVGIVLPTIHKTHISFDSASSQLLNFAEEILSQMSHCASRLTLSQLERLITPSINIITKLLFYPCSSNIYYNGRRVTVFPELSRLCEKCVIAQCLTRIGFFSHIVSGLLDDALFIGCTDVIDIFLHQARYSDYGRAHRKMFRSAIPNFLEEGLQDAVDIVLVKTRISVPVSNAIEHLKAMMNFHGTNL
ncbi:hypothetical protein BLNAU_3109 [Blattamonas nauphoetae]|uniref:Uncharacterized protein n=1 Tax=Blattamonas nauphoetae TaxID=2049346 RepID=A0ABQ9YE73_9EUKA|nr:hypothetical protein BLNAU_3109 [Blattamonas nauphoetae]